MRHWYIVHRADKRLSTVAQAFKEFLLGPAGDTKPGSPAGTNTEALEFLRNRRDAVVAAVDMSQWRMMGKPSTFSTTSRSAPFPSPASAEDAETQSACTAVLIASLLLISF